MSNTIQIERHETGSLGKLQAFFYNMNEIVKEASEKAARAAAEQFLEELKANWEGQYASLAPLNAAYKQHKQRTGLDERILIATGELLSSIEVIEQDGAFVVGAPKGQTHSRTGILLEDLLKIIEYGSPTKKIPPRPILRSTAATVRGLLIRIFKRELKQAITAQLKR